MSTYPSGLATQTTKPVVTYTDTTSRNLTTAQKREIIKTQLRTNFPVKTDLFFALFFIAIGLTAIGLQIALIVYQSVNYQIGNGIWGGCFAILNGLIKLNMLRTKGYSSYLLAQLLTPFVAILTSVGLTLISGINMRQYPCSTFPACHPRNLQIILAMFIIGLVGLVFNLFFLFAFNIVLFGGCRSFCKHRLGIKEVLGEISHICCAGQIVSY